ncbi:MAG: 50S ribosomal protein L9, partial [Clostridia bacterium]|nr:50S ribosomal protein L9 [Clostridia bacterium]
DGFGRNFLLKKGLATQATAANVHQATQQKEAKEFHRAEEVKALKELAAQINGKSVSVKIKTGENGKTFGSVTPAHVSAALADIGFDVDKKKIKMDAVKTLGSFNAEVRLMEGVVAKILVTVESL